MKELDRSDLIFCLRRLPKAFLEIIKRPRWANKVFLGGGFIRSVIANEPINDVDIFVPTKEDAEMLANEIRAEMNVKRVHKTEFASTLVGTSPTLQIIHKWMYDRPQDVIGSFDFTICQAVIWWDGGQYRSECSERYYRDLAAKRLVYTKPKRIEEAGGSTLRLLKYYQKGYRTPLDSLGATLARLFMAVDMEAILGATKGLDAEDQIAKVLTGLLRTVDPNIDPTSEAHLPSQSNEVKID